MKKQSSSQSALARAEWAIVIGLLFVVIGTSLPAWWSLKRYRAHSMVQSDMAVVIAATRDFHSEYGIWPSEHSGEYGDYRYGRGVANAQMFNVLRAIDGEGNRDHQVNPRRIEFIRISESDEGLSGIDAVGNFVDPWGQQYQIVLDTDMDDVCDIEYSIHERPIGEGILMWSCGFDSISDTSDDILSWHTNKR